MNYNNPMDFFNKKLIGKIVAAVILVVIVAAAVIGSGIYMKIIQLNEIGKNLSTVYTTNLLYQVIFAAAAFIVIFILVAVTNIIIKKNIKTYLRQNEMPPKRLPNYIIAGIMALIGAFITKDFFYTKALNFLNAKDFGEKTPLFGNLDVGYFVFQRPFLMSLYQFLSALWLLIIVYTAIYYLIVLITIYSNLTIQDLKIKTIIRHNLINIAVFFIIKAFSYKFQKEGLVYSGFANVNGGAGYVDIHVWKRYFEFAPFLLIIIVLAAMIFIWRGKLKGAAVSIAVFPVAWVVVAIIATATQSLVVKPNELSYESPYLKYNMEQTRKAFKLNNVISHNYSDMTDITPDIINKNADTMKNIRVVDYDATLSSDRQLQSNTNFYTFNDGDIINYKINGVDTPVFITAREINKANIPQLTYINSTFKYTHGYGVVINPINQLTQEGQVQFILNGLKAKSIDPNINVKEPRIYYGEITNDHVIVNPPNAGKEKEIDYDGTVGKETSYTGQGGIKLNLINKLLFAAKYGDLNMLISNNISSDSRLLLNRQIIERAQMGAPFLKVDSDPYIMIDNGGRLKWVMDAYTSTNNYPYAQHYGNLNYIRNSVKIVVDAYDGKVKYYIIDKNDPIILAYDKMYPGVLSHDSLPADVASHTRYPEELFKLQTEVIKRYHLDPDVKENISMFYSNQDLWNIARFPDKENEGGYTDIEPYYNMIKLPDGIGDKEEMILMRPFTPSGDKHNMVSWLSVRNSYGDNGKNYGQLILFNYPKNTNIFGPDQVEVNINQISEVSQDMTLWGQRGSSVFKGSLLVIPIENSILYVEPIYIKAAGNSSIPQVKRIVVGFQKGDDFKYGIGNDLNSAIQSLFKNLGGTGTAAPVTPVIPSDTTSGPAIAAPSENTQDSEKTKTINEIMAKYDQLKKQLDDMGKLIDKLKK